MSDKKWQITKNLRKAECCYTCDHGLQSNPVVCLKHKESLPPHWICNDYDDRIPFTETKKEE